MSVYEVMLLSAIEIVGDFGLKIFANGGGWVPLLVGLSGYIGVVVMLIITFQNSTVLMVNGAWDGISAIMNSIAAYVLLGERFDEPSQYVGVILIAVGLFMLKIPLKKATRFIMPKL